MAADGSVTRYEYKGNTTKVTDGAGKWKKFTHDAMGNLVQVNEPDPAGGADYITSYSYDGMNHLTQVSMPRHGMQQTRTFVWNGADMISATNPENGTVTYTYDAAHRVAVRTDAKGQKTHYDRDAYGRLTQVWHELIVNGQLVVAPSQTVRYDYDINPYDGLYSQNAWGRLTAVTVPRERGDTLPNAELLTYQYSYNAAGRVLKQRMTFGRSGTTWSTLEATYGWDNEGRMTSMSNPTGNTYNYQFDAMGRVNRMTDATGVTTFGMAAYGPAGS
jgi:YD repeat-containing protein